MFTPQEVRERPGSFEKAVFGGYSMNTVDDFLSQLSEDYAALYKENAVLKSKMKVLVEQLEKYHDQEESLNKAIMAAQKTADEMVVEAERKCAKMMSDTEQSLRQRDQELKVELAAEAERVARAKKTAAAFVEEVENQVHMSLSHLERIRQMTLSVKSSQKAEPAPAAPAAPVTPAPSLGDKAETINAQSGERMGRILAQSADSPEAQMGDTMVIPTAE